MVGVIDHATNIRDIRNGTAPLGVLRPVALWCYGWFMQTTISQREFRNDSGAIMRRVENGERFTVTRNGVPVADLIPHEQAGSDRRQRFVPVGEIAAGVAGLPPWNARSFTREQRLLDEAVDDRDTDRWIDGT